MHKLVFINIAIIILCSCTASASMENKYSGIFCDENGVFLENINDTSAVFISTSHKRYLVKMNAVEYIGGENQLIDDIRYSGINDKYEMNIRQFFVIFFDNNMNIIEVRMSNYFDNFISSSLLSSYKKDYINLIKQSQGKWQKRIADEKFYLYVFYVRT